MTSAASDWTLSGWMFLGTQIITYHQSMHFMNHYSERLMVRKDSLVEMRDERRGTRGWVDKGEGRMGNGNGIVVCCACTHVVSVVYYNGDVKWDG